ncbi:MAG: cell division protein FtsZ [Bacteroidales bacterium]|nr:cell division protein FtsZ [Bacteroidales bacterium]
MADEIMNFDLPVERSSIIKVLGIGGGGNNAVNHMFDRGIKDVNFVICNTDHQALEGSSVPLKVQIGEALTEGRGAGSKPDVGRQAAIENIGDVMHSLSGNTKMVFLTTGMGGGTGTGAAPVIAKACRDAGYLTIAVVTIPFKSEGRVRINHAVEGVNALKDHVDSLLIINNEKLREIYGDQPVSVAFAKADDVLATAVKGIAEIITVTGYINVDFADVETVMRNSGVAVMGMGSASGENRAISAIEAALNSPLLNSSDITGAKSILINIISGTGDSEITMDELGEITDYMYDVASDDALIIRGLSKDESLGEEISVIVIATGFESNSVIEPYKPPVKTEKVMLNPGRNITPIKASPTPTDDTFVVREKGNLVTNIGDEKVQGRLNFGLEEKSEFNSTGGAAEGQAKLTKLKEMQTMLKQEGMTSKTMTENIDSFEDVPAYVRRNIVLNKADSVKSSKISKLTLSTDENQQPVIRENNAYLNDNVD